MSPRVKICGVSTVDVLEAAVSEGASDVGLVFFPRSPRNVSAEQAAALSAAAPDDVTVVGLFVDPPDETLESVLSVARLDLLQLHGSESPERVAAIRRRTGKPAMKAIKVAGPDDIAAARRYDGIADRLLFDAKAPSTEGRYMPGGNALTFDWRMLAGLDWPCPWMLSGGLTPETVADAIRTSGAPGVDVSSGVESAPGVKDTSLIAAFIRAAEGA
ncbi:MAG: phosphoribosylanthranilate isomerase [Defluviicoccus sp.]|nr:phosphoribosylanthranilate isomerase [Defluviicoccus sp.]MDE0274391.1 phosphoribosylanthranilate isomerase [Defluviicoccus sp.]